MIISIPFFTTSFQFFYNSIPVFLQQYSSFLQQHSIFFNKIPVFFLQQNSSFLQQHSSFYNYSPVFLQRHSSFLQQHYSFYNYIPVFYNNIPVFTITFQFLQLHSSFYNTIPVFYWITWYCFFCRYFNISSYLAVESATDEIYVCTTRAARNMSFQDMLKTTKSIKPIAHIPGKYIFNFVGTINIRRKYFLYMSRFTTCVVLQGVLTIRTHKNVSKRTYKKIFASFFGFLTPRGQK